MTKHGLYMFNNGHNNSMLSITFQENDGLSEIGENPLERLNTD